MRQDLTVGNERKAMLRFAYPMILGNILQQLYNIADTMVVGRFIGPEALAAVGTSFTLMVFLTSVIGGLCMGSGVWLSMLYGEGNERDFKTSVFLSFLMIALATVAINAAVFAFLGPILGLLRVPGEIVPLTAEYLRVIFTGIIFTFLYNFLSAILRSIGNSAMPVICVAVSALLNIGLDLLFVVTFGMGVSGAALATVAAQAVSAVLVAAYIFLKVDLIRPDGDTLRLDGRLARRIAQYSILTSLQQSIMNFGILMIQGLINSFGVAVTAAFAAAVKIDAFAYMPVQDFGNAFSTFVAQNYGAKKTDRLHRGIRSAVLLSTAFSLVISAVVWFFAGPLMRIFVRAEETEIIAIGVNYLRIEGAFYIGIGLLFLLYGYYRGIGKAGMSVVLTVISLGTRVALAYLLAPVPWIGLPAIWWAIPIGWILADLTGFACYFRTKP